MARRLTSRRRRPPPPESAAPHLPIYRSAGPASWNHARQHTPPTFRRQSPRDGPAATARSTGRDVTGLATPRPASRALAAQRARRRRYKRDDDAFRRRTIARPSTRRSVRDDGNAEKISTQCGAQPALLAAAASASPSVECRLPTPLSDAFSARHSLYIVSSCDAAYMSADSSSGNRVTLIR